MAVDVVSFHEVEKGEKKRRRTEHSETNVEKRTLKYNGLKIRRCRSPEAF